VTSKETHRRELPRATSANEVRLLPVFCNHVLVESHLRCVLLVGAELALESLDLQMNRAQMTFHVHLREGFEVAKVAEELRHALGFVRVTEFDVSPKLASLLVVFTANVAHMRQEIGVFVEHQMVVVAAGCLAFVMTHFALEDVACVNLLEMFVLQLPLVENRIAQVAFEGGWRWFSLRFRCRRRFWTPQFSLRRLSLLRKSLHRPHRIVELRQIVEVGGSVDDVVVVFIDGLILHSIAYRVHLEDIRLAFNFHGERRKLGNFIFDGIPQDFVRVHAERFDFVRREDLRPAVETHRLRESIVDLNLQTKIFRIFQFFSPGNFHFYFDSTAKGDELRRRSLPDR
jgi:hypothetical protein